MKHWIGTSVVVIGALHTVAGVLFFGDMLPAVLREGLFNTVGFEQPAGRNAAFWFFYCGFLLLIFGGLIGHVERLGGRLPVFLPWSLLAFALTGAVFMPGSGFWLLLVPVAGAFLQRKHAAEAQAR